MQISGGTISVSVGSTTVTGTNIDWSQVNDPSVRPVWLVVNGLLFICNAINVDMDELEISPAYNGSVDLVDEANYVLVQDFTSSYNLPLLNPGDSEAAVLWSRAMNVIDGLLAGGGGGEEVSIAQTAHGFQVGNALRWTGSAWDLADSTTSTNAEVICVVSSVVDTGNFKARTNGTITGITGISLSSGTVYYLKDDTSSGVNLTDNPATYSTLEMPLLFATGTSSGFLLNMGAAKPAVFDVGIDGLVPGPSAENGYFLKDDGTWAASTVTARSVAAGQAAIANTTIDFDNLLTDGSTLSLSRHILDLHDRITTLETMGGGGNVAYFQKVFTRATNTSSTSDLTEMYSPKYANVTTGVPSNVTMIYLTLVSGTLISLQYDYFQGRSVLVYWDQQDPMTLRVEIPVIPTDNVYIYLGKQRTVFNHASNANGSTNVIVKKNGDKIVDLLGNIRTGIAGSEFNSWSGAYIEASLGKKWGNSTAKALKDYYGGETNSDYWSEISYQVSQLQGDQIGTQGLILRRQFYAGAVVLEYGYGVVLG